MVTIKDVARRAGVSSAAVSYAWNNTGRVTDETREMILKVCDEMGYIPNSLARGLTTQKTNVIGLIVPDMLNLYNLFFIKYLEEYVRASGYSLLLGCTDYDSGAELASIREFVSKKVDALVVVPDNFRKKGFYADVIKDMKDRNTFLLFAGMQPHEADGFCVTIDFENGMFKLTSSLIGSGYTKFVFAGHDRSNYYANMKRDGFLRAMKAEKLQELHCIEVDRSHHGYDDGIRLAAEYMEGHEQPEVFICSNDSLAYGFADQLRQSGCRVPEDVAVTGYDDIHFIPFRTPFLSSVRVPLDSMAKCCVDLVQAGHINTVRTVLDTDIVLRESTLSSI